MRDCQKLLRRASDIYKRQHSKRPQTLMMTPEFLAELTKLHNKTAPGYHKTWEAIPIILNRYLVEDFLFGLLPIPLTEFRNEV